ncbi:MAG: hypothetical protein CMB99_10675 [Flavobacteriaceae bacterium]|nr:hypothetical protein [Flavobacteriaceae bacterium]|tara:strand:- start:198052 stop:198546 length:495 start_codon:yes stop_codon:yes gene_type:complete
MEFNFLIFLGAAFVPMIIGFVWYGPLFGKAWMNLIGFTEESLKEGNMLVIMGLSLVFSFILAMMVQFLVVHQMGVYGTLMPAGATELTGESLELFNQIMDKYGDAHRSFKHGALHGAMAGLFFAMPVLSIQAMFERKKAKYIFINVGYWVITLALMGGIVCQWG